MATKFKSKADAAHLRLLPFGKKHAVRALIEELQPGELLRIGSEEFLWKRKTPNYFCQQISKATKAKFKVYKEFGKTGWVIERIA